MASLTLYTRHRLVSINVEILEMGFVIKIYLLDKIVKDILHKLSKKYNCIQN